MATTITTTETAETIWFKILSLLIALVFIGFTLANVIYFNRLRSGLCTAVTRGQANSMFWVNIILLIIASILFAWTLIRLIITLETREKITKTLVSPNL
jgi:hypothetical protein